jgi:hypothetical protein
LTSVVFPSNPPLFNCHAWPLKFSKHTFNLFFLQIWSFSLLLFILFEIIYKIRFFSQFHPLIFSFVRFGPYSFDYYLFYLTNFLNWFFLFHPSTLNWLWIEFFFDFKGCKFGRFACVCWSNFLNWYFFFLISSFNIKLFGNWAYWLSQGLGFHEFQVWKINLDLRDSFKFS